MRPHAFYIVTGTCYRSPTTWIIPGDNTPRSASELSAQQDLHWIVATCLTPTEAVAVRDVLTDNMRMLTEDLRGLDKFPRELRLASSPVHVRLGEAALDPYLTAHAQDMAARIEANSIPTYDVVRSYDDFTKIAEIVDAVFIESGKECNP